MTYCCIRLHDDNAASTRGTQLSLLKGPGVARQKGNVKWQTQGPLTSNLVRSSMSTKSVLSKKVKSWKTGARKSDGDDEGLGVEE